MNSKEFYETLVPEHRRDDFYEKVYSKLFSLISKIFKGLFEINFSDNRMVITGTINKSKAEFAFDVLADNASWSKIPDKITPTKVIFPSGYELGSSWRPKYYYVMYPNGDIVDCYATSNLEVATNHDDVIQVFNHYNHLEEYLLLHNKDKWINPRDELNDFKFNQHFLPTEDFYKFKKGIIYKKGKDISYYRNSSFKRVYENRYRDFQKYNVDLRGDIPVPDQEMFKCLKQKYGCQHGCTHSCLSKSVKSKNNSLYESFVKLKQKL